MKKQEETAGKRISPAGRGLAGRGGRPGEKIKPGLSRV